MTDKSVHMIELENFHLFVRNIGRLVWKENFIR